MCTENCQLIPLAYAHLANLVDNLLNLKTQYPCCDHVMGVRRALRPSSRRPRKISHATPRLEASSLAYALVVLGSWSARRFVRTPSPVMPLLLPSFRHGVSGLARSVLILISCHPCSHVGRTSACQRTLIFQMYVCAARSPSMYIPFPFSNAGWGVGAGG